MAEFKRAVEIKPRRPMGYLMQAAVFKAAGDIYGRIEKLKRAVEFSREIALRMELAAAQAAVGRTSNAIAEYKAIISDRPNYINAYLKLIDIHAGRSDWPEQRQGGPCCWIR